MRNNDLLLFDDAVRYIRSDTYFYDQVISPCLRSGNDREFSRIFGSGSYPIFESLYKANNTDLAVTVLKRSLHFADGPESINSFIKDNSVYAKHKVMPEGFWDFQLRLSALRSGKDCDPKAGFYIVQWDNYEPFEDGPEKDTAQAMDIILAALSDKMNTLVSLDVFGRSESVNRIFLPYNYGDYFAIYVNELSKGRESALQDAIRSIDGLFKARFGKDFEADYWSVPLKKVVAKILSDPDPGQKGHWIHSLFDFQSDPLVKRQDRGKPGEEADGDFESFLIKKEPSKGKAGEKMPAFQIDWGDIGEKLLFLPFVIGIIYVMAHSCYDYIRGIGDPYGYIKYSDEIRRSLNKYDYFITSNISLFDIRFDKKKKTLYMRYTPEEAVSNAGRDFLVKEGYYSAVSNNGAGERPDDFLRDGGTFQDEYYTREGTNLSLFYTFRLTRSNVRLIPEEIDPFSPSPLVQKVKKLFLRLFKSREAGLTNI